MNFTNLCLFLALVACALLLATSKASPPDYLPYDDSDDSIDYDRLRLIPREDKRAGCVVRGGNCDHRPNDCCLSTNCRCNLWGVNCRCARKGLFNNLG